MNKKILIVEDEQVLLNILVDKFGKEGFETIAALNGRVGLDLAIKEHPDVILLDILMPVMNGMQMLDELRKDPWGKNAQVILLTNLSDPENEAVSSRLDVFDYLIKCDMTLNNIVRRVKEKTSLKK